jgi:hypothetical protein
MYRNNNDTFVLVKDSTGERFLCPVKETQNPSTIRIEENDDCIEEDVIRRYSGNINIKPS